MLDKSERRKDRLGHFRNNLILILNGRQRSIKKIKEQIESALAYDDAVLKIYGDE